MSLNPVKGGEKVAMLITRLFHPADNDILYHYCSASSFHAILDSGKIRFTDINMLNDNAEMHWGYSVFEEAAGKLIKIAEEKESFKDLDKSFFDKVDQIIAPLQNRFHPFVSCFSREPDLLGQWRAYADDAHGFAIGFDAKALKYMPASLLAVEYDREKQVQEMINALGACFMQNEDDGHKFGTKFFESCVLIGSYMLAFKNPIFREEKEIRCLHLVDVEASEKIMKLTDSGGVLGGKDEVSGEPIGFRIQVHALVAYLDISFRRGFESSAIKNIMLGAKNPNLPGNVLYFAGSHGYENVTLRKSISTYR
jgi:hypothetical protein